MENGKSTRKRIFRIITYVLSALIFALAVYVFVNVYLAKRDNRPVAVFGHSYHVVLTGSMEPTIQVGDFVMTRRAEIEEVLIGDVITFRCDDPSQAVYGQYIIHRVVAETVTEDGRRALITKGDANEAEDALPVTAANFSGIYAGRSGFMGGVVRFFGNAVNWIFLFALAAVAYFAYRMAKRIVRETKETKDRDAEKERLLAAAKELGIETDSEKPPRKSEDGPPSSDLTRRNRDRK